MEAAGQAALRLDDPQDPEALHDFRVAVRRIRSALRAWQPELKKSVRKRDRRALASLQRATGGGRDAEVALEWLAQVRPELSPAHRLGHDWLVGRLEQRHVEALDHARGGVRDAFERLRAELTPQLEVVTVRKHLLAGPAQARFAVVLAERVRRSAAEVVERLSRIGSVEETTRCHEARVAGKRLRYLVEPVRDQSEPARALVKRCRRLQDLLGDVHDAHVQRDDIGAALEDAAAARARHLHDLARDADDGRLRREARRSERSGLIELTRRAQARIGALYQRLQAEWLDGGMVALIEDAEELATQLEAASRRPVEIERKFLLRGPVDFSPVAARVESEEIRQGWLPGDRLRERLRKTVGPGGVRYARTVKLGAGVERIEIEEATTPQVFEVLWPLTEGCRVHKRRHRVREGDLVWEIDEFLDRPLWLAEVEIEDAAEVPEPPSWLSPQLDREVTDDPRFTNLKLAR